MRLSSPVLLLSVFGVVGACSSSDDASDDSTASSSGSGSSTSSSSGGSSGGSSTSSSSSSGSTSDLDAAADAVPAATCTDGQKNGGETDVDCGGTCPNKCDLKKGCATSADCTSNNCDPTTKTCESCSDKVKNGTETAVDCGGTCPLKCAEGEGCVALTDCQPAFTCNVTCKKPLFEGFEGLTPPKLPAGWSADAGWASETGGLASSGSGYVYIEGGGDTSLVSTTYAIETTTGKLSFRHRYAMGSTGGAALEISIDGGGYQDILAAGGTFTANGYSAGTMSAGPLAGRPAWQGSNGSSYRTVSVTLPAAAANKNVTFRWRDCGSLGTFWFIDAVTVVP